MHFPNSPINAWSLFLLCGNLSAQEEAVCINIVHKESNEAKSQEKEELNEIVDSADSDESSPEEEVGISRSSNNNFILVLDNWISFKMER